MDQQQNERARERAQGGKNMTQYGALVSEQRCYKLFYANEK